VAYWRKLLVMRFHWENAARNADCVVLWLGPYAEG